MQQNQPEITVILSAFNAEHDITKSVNSILNQSFQNFELLIADDYSTDNTKKIIEGYTDKRIRKFYNSKNKHLVETWNELAQNARGKYIVFHDADDTINPKRIELLYKHAEANPNLALVGSNYLRQFPKWKETRKSNFGLTHHDIWTAFEKHQRIELIKPLIKKIIFEEFGGFRPFFSRLGWEDYDLYIRIMEKYEVANISEPLYDYNYTPNSSSKLDLSKVNFKKLFISNIGVYLYNQRIQYGFDAIMDHSLLGEFNHFLKKLEDEFIASPGLVYERMARNQIANKDFIAAFNNVKTVFSIEKNFTKTWSLFLFWLKSALKSLIKYIKVI